MIPQRPAHHLVPGIAKRIAIGIEFELSLSCSFNYVDLLHVPLAFSSSSSVFIKSMAIPPTADWTIFFALEVVVFIHELIVDLN